MDRTQFYSIELAHNQQELDYLKNSISKFTMNYDPLYYRVNETDLMRPDMISYKNYGTVKYWWLLMSVNQIFDPFNDLSVGQRLTVPNLVDIYDFYKKFNLR